MWNEITLEELDENTNKSTKQLGVNSTVNSDVWKFDSSLAARPILAKFPNITRTINP
jgi:hypothetical protein